LDFQTLQKGDIISTYADIEASKRDLGFEPRTSIDESILKLVELLWVLGSQYKNP